MTKPYKVQDAYFKKAKAEGYRARSVYKLEEIDNKFKIFHKGQNVLDLGCAPGSWTQYIAEKIQDKNKGKIIGIDLTEVEPIEGAVLYQCDAFSEELTNILEKEKIKNFDVIVSDMAPKTSGIFDVDQYASVELNLKALDICQEYLKANGIAVFKIFRGSDFNDFWNEAKKLFPNIKTYKPEACRDRSFEIYCIGKKK